MSVEAIRHVYAHPTKGAKQSVLAVLAWHADREGRGGSNGRSPSQATLARKSGLSVSGVKNALTALEQERRIVRQGDPGARGKVFYDVVMEPAESASHGPVVAPGQTSLFDTALASDLATTCPDVWSPGGHLKDVNDQGKTTPSLDLSPEGGLEFRVETGSRWQRRERRGRADRTNGRRAQTPALRRPAPPSCPLDRAAPGSLSELEEIWQPMRVQIRDAVSETTWNIWLETLHLHPPSEEQPGALVLGVEDDRASWVISNFSRLLVAAARAVGYDRPVSVEGCAGPALTPPTAGPALTVGGAA